ncbi:MAG: hypothetical protein WDZ35_05870 [Crocinitomicaceae bacterium]
MKLFWFFIIVLSFSLNGFSQDQKIDSSEDEKKVKKATIGWADSTFYQHENYKFEHFKAFYTDEYFIQIMRVRMYKERLDDLETLKSSGNYKKSDEEYEKEHKELKDAYENVTKDVENFKFRVSHYQIHFWSNVQTDDGITVYYEFIVKLNNDYAVTNAVINSAIGKKDSNTQIVYKKGVEPLKKK